MAVARKTAPTYHNTLAGRQMLAAVARAASAVPKASASDPHPQGGVRRHTPLPRFPSVTRAPRRASRAHSGDTTAELLGDAVRNLT